MRAYSNNKYESHEEKTMRRYTTHSWRSRQQNRQHMHRRHLHIEQLEGRRMLCGDSPYDFTWQQCAALENPDCVYTVLDFLKTGADEKTADAAARAWKQLDSLGYTPEDTNYDELFNDFFEQELKLLFIDTNNTADGNNTATDGKGWQTGAGGLPYYNLEDTGEDSNNTQQESGDNTDKLTWAWDDNGESSGPLDPDDKLVWAWEDDDESEEDDSSNDDDDDGITWFWEDDEEDEEEKDDENGDNQSRQSEESRNDDPFPSGNGPDPRQGGLGRPGGTSTTDPAPYRGVIVQGGDRDPSDSESGLKGPGAVPAHPTYGVIDYGPDGKPVDYQGYLPPKDLLVQGGDTDPPKHEENTKETGAVDAVFRAWESSVPGDPMCVTFDSSMQTTGQSTVDLGGNLPTFKKGDIDDHS